MPLSPPARRHMALGKRPREIGAVVEDQDVVVAGGSEVEQQPDYEPAHQEAASAKRRRLAGFGLGIFSELVGKVYRATASVFSRGAGAER